MSNRELRVSRLMDAPVELVWEAWTTAEILDQWVAPKPWRAETKTMDFREGGYWHYAMVSPEGQRHWSRYDYQKIEPLQRIVELRGFCDESGTINPEIKCTNCTNIFSENEGITLVSVTAQYGSPEVLEFMVTHGFKEGTTASLENLDALLAKSKK